MIGNPLGPGGDVVAEEADRAAEERRQRLFAIDAQRHELFVEDAHGIGDRCVEAQAAARIETDERVAAEVLAALDAFEEERFLPVARQRVKRHDRRKCVGAHLAHDRNDIELRTPCKSHGNTFMKR